MNHILVIDDEPGISDLIRDALMRFGYRVETASNGCQGLKLLTNARFDMVVTDMCLPDVDGACIVRYIRTSRRPLIPVIGISGTPWRLDGAGCDAVLPKPFRLKDLVDVVNRLQRTGLAAPHEPTPPPLFLNTQHAL